MLEFVCEKAFVMLISYFLDAIFTHPIFAPAVQVILTGNLVPPVTS